MKKFLGLFAGLLLVLGLYHGATAAWNIIQKDDGTATWRNTIGDVGGGDIEHPIGSVYLTVQVPDVSTASTVAVVSPVTRVRISSIRHVLSGQITGTNAVYDMYVVTGLTDGNNTVEEVTNATGRLTITACTAPTCTEGAGTVDTFTPISTGTTAKMQQGSVLLIHTNGGSTNAVDAVMTITLQPY